MNLVKTVVVQKVFCTLQVEATHNWPDCNIEEVSYLQHPHRHMFGIKATAIVNHANRNIEFIELKHKIRDYMEQKYYNKTNRIHEFGSQSCEMIGRELMDEFNLVEVSVDEDGENGSILTKVEV